MRRKPPSIRLVTWDLDGTLIRPQAFTVVGEALGWGERLRESYDLYRKGALTLEEAFDRDFRLFVGEEVEVLQRILRKSPAWVPGIPQATQALRSVGIESALLTDQPHFLAEVVREKGIPLVLGSEAEVEEGIVTGRIRPAFDKWKRLSEFLRWESIDPHEVVHVGNGPNDIPVFRNVGWAIAVDWIVEDVRRAADVGIHPWEDARAVVEVLLGEFIGGTRREDPRGGQRPPS